MPKTHALIAALMLSGCAAQGKQLAPVIPDFPPPPVDINSPVGPEMLPYLNCVTQEGSTSLHCHSLIPLTLDKSTIGTEPKS